MNSESIFVSFFNKERFRFGIEGLVLIVEDPVNIRAYTMCIIAYILKIIVSMIVIPEHKLD
jgi:hypothetical protein